jgi:hypothetical protein
MMTSEAQPEARSVTVGAAVTPTEADRLNALAERMGTTKSGALRAALVAGLERLEGVEGDALPSPGMTRVEVLAEAVLTQLAAQDRAYRKAFERIFEGVEDLRSKVSKR